MSDAIIQVENLGKMYRLSHQGDRPRYTALRDVLAEKAKRLFGRLKIEDRSLNPSPISDLSSSRASREDFWALKDVSFSVRQGEVVGIIGRNGAGKSTLLKILSRITEPTTGRVHLRGRVASLLEVGTGFHPELTGRENIFLNGAILGMTRVEIKRKFDEIVAFAEVEKFLDTPVKRYSSGMYVRLAFAVAAHLEPEILIVDEVLAVGDVQFQKKCLGKMEQVARAEGRTVLFVSHNLDSILRLCSSSLWLEGGRLRQIGDVKAVINNYQHHHRDQSRTVDLANAIRPFPYREIARFVEISCPIGGEQAAWNYRFGEPLNFECIINVSKTVSYLTVAFAIFTGTGFEIASTRCCLFNGDNTISAGRYRVKLSTTLRLAPGIYKLNLGMRSEAGDEDFIPEAPAFEISTNQQSAELMADFIRAACIPECDATLLKESEG